MRLDRAAVVQNGCRCVLWDSDVASDSLARCVDDDDGGGGVVKMDPLSVT